jgi:Peptidase inhibitor family I36
LLALVSALLTAPGQAQAEDSVLVVRPSLVQDSRCPDNTLCLFENTNFGGGRSVITGTLRNFNGHVFNNGVPLSNGASSMINRTNHVITLGHQPNSCGAPVYTARGMSEDSTFVNNHFNDQANCAVFI